MLTLVAPPLFAARGVPHLLPALHHPEHLALLPQARLHRVFPSGTRSRSSVCQFSRTVRPRPTRHRRHRGKRLCSFPRYHRGSRRRNRTPARSAPALNPLLRDRQGFTPPLPPARRCRPARLPRRTRAAPSARFQRRRATSSRYSITRASLPMPHPRSSRSRTQPAGAGTEARHKLCACSPLRHPLASS